MISAKEIETGSIVGLHYSGQHDSAVSIVSPEGKLLFATSLERVTRIKKDGRFPKELLDPIPWHKISKVAITTEKKYTAFSDNESLFHPVKRLKESSSDRSHKKIFHEQLDMIPAEKLFFSHHLCHASSAFYASGYEDAICLVYDGGISNDHWFGGVYSASVDGGINAIDKFSTESYGNITFVYTIVTALLGFSPLKHEGKITGLAALGKVSDECKKLLNTWLEEPEKVWDIIYWENEYSSKSLPALKVNILALERTKKLIKNFSKEDVAATVQNLAEDHILYILKNIKTKGYMQNNICLSGGLFANVKINQKISEFGFENIFVAPPMSDEGTSLGAAWLALLENKKVEIEFNNVYLGNDGDIDAFLKRRHDFVFEEPDNIEEFIAEKLSKGLIFAIYQGRSEFGPRALGNRSIIAQATQADINNGLNNKLSRTEFMPFAPIIRDIDAAKYFYFKNGELFASKFMTITMNCTKEARRDCPAVVHVDNTARPQIVEHGDNPLIYKILTEYAAITGKFALVNTSFNIHEEPIVDSYEDAIKGFFESGLDYLYLDGIIISLSDNYKLHASYLKNKLDSEKALVKEKISIINKYHILLSEAELKANKAEEKTKEVSNKYHEILNSNSWKFMRPYRKLGHLLKR